MLPHYLANVKNRKQIAKRLRQLLTIAAQKLTLPLSDYIAYVPDEFNSKNILGVNSNVPFNSISIGISRQVHGSVTDQYHSELRVFIDGHSHIPGYRARSHLFLRYGERFAFRSTDLLEMNNKRFVYSPTLAAALRTMIKLHNQTIQEHADNQTQRFFDS